jgi:hypothetical protein
MYGGVGSKTLLWVLELLQNDKIQRMFSLLLSTRT